MTPLQQAITMAVDAATGDAYRLASSFISAKVGEEDRTGAAMALAVAAIGLLRGVAPNRDMVDGFLLAALEFPVPLTLEEDRTANPPRGIFQ